MLNFGRVLKTSRVIMLRVIAALFLMITIPGPSFAQATVEKAVGAVAEREQLDHDRFWLLPGTIQNENGEPLFGAWVWAHSICFPAVTGLDGGFSLAIPPGLKTIYVSCRGYNTIEYYLGTEASECHLDFTPSLVRLDGSSPAGRLAFYHHDTLAKRIRDWWLNRNPCPGERQQRREARRLMRQDEESEEYHPITSQNTGDAIDLPSSHLSQITVAPNPFASSVSLAWNQQAEQSIQVRLFDERGRELWNGHYEALPGTNNWTIQLDEHLPAATYFLHLEDEEGTQAIHTIIKQ